MAVLLVILMPMIQAVEIQISRQPTTLCSSLSYEEFINMDTAALIAYISEILEQYPDLHKHFTSQLNGLKSESYSVAVSDEIHKIQDGGTQSKTTNQTFLEKIYWKIFNYRVFRLYLSTCIFLYTHSKIMFFRTINWAIKLLRLVKVGIILGYIDPTPQQPEKPEIIFSQDVVNKTLTVVSAKPDTLQWSDIDEIGSGSCDPFPTGTVTVGQQLTNCCGIIVLRYKPSGSIVGVFEFP
ncbi:MAG: hypothetical protein QXL17_07450 [Candidatus Thermoplasmatota archaeon]